MTVIATQHGVLFADRTVSIGDTRVEMNKILPAGGGTFAYTGNLTDVQHLVDCVMTKTPVSDHKDNCTLIWMKESGAWYYDANHTGFKLDPNSVTIFGSERAISYVQVAMASRGIGLEQALIELCSHDKDFAGLDKVVGNNGEVINIVPWRY